MSTLIAMSSIAGTCSKSLLPGPSCLLGGWCEGGSFQGHGDGQSPAAALARLPCLCCSVLWPQDNQHIRHGLDTPLYFRMNAQIQRKVSDAEKVRLQES